MASRPDELRVLVADEESEGVAPDVVADGAPDIANEEDWGKEKTVSSRNDSG